jgi:hypothetical protein
MKKDEIKAGDPLEKFIKEAGTVSPGDDFHLSVLRKIEALPKVTTAYEPVISPLAWKCIAGIVLAIAGWSVWISPAPSESYALLESLRQIKLPMPRFSLYNYISFSQGVSPQFLMGLVAFFVMGFLIVVKTIRNQHADI